MRVVPGGTYWIGLELENAEQIGPVWLVGAFASAFPDAHILSVDEYQSDFALVHVRWSRTTGEILQGTVISGLAEGLLLPPESVPSGTVVSVVQAAARAPDLEARLPNSMKLALAGGFLLTTWYFAVRIKEKHGQS